MIQDFFLAERRFFPPIFRVCMGLYFLYEIIISWQFAYLYSPDYQFLPDSAIAQLILTHYEVFLVVFAIVSLAFVFGVGRYFVGLLMFFCVYIHLRINPLLSTWGDNIVYYQMLFFIGVYSYHSWVWKKGGFPKTGLKLQLHQVFIACMILHVFLVYISNLRYKLLDDSWINGSAFSFAILQHEILPPKVFLQWAQQEWMAKILTYTVLLQQLLFVPLILWKGTRWFMVIFSVLVHLGLAWGLHLWQFQAVMILSILMVLTDKDWAQLPLRSFFASR